MNSRDHMLREIAILKKINNTLAWKGKILHGIIADYYKKTFARESVSVEEIVKKVRDQIQKDISSSESFLSSNLEERLERAAHGEFVLLEHLCGGKGISMSDESIAHEIEESFGAFYEWQCAEGIDDLVTKSSRCWIEPDIFGKDAPVFDLDGVSVIAKVDLAIEDHLGNIIIFDWKTGKQIENSPSRMSHPELQASIYQLWPHIKYAKELDKIAARFVYIKKENIGFAEYRIDENKKEDVIGRVRRSISRMEYFDNTILGESQMKLGDSPTLALKDLNYSFFSWACTFCQYKIVCKRSLEQ